MHNQRVRIPPSTNHERGSAVGTDRRIPRRRCDIQPIGSGGAVHADDSPLLVRPAGTHRPARVGRGD